ncbi:MAG: translocation/assembly module TamB domain-containing protein [candidate division FCPU426 bacterium]
MPQPRRVKSSRRPRPARRKPHLPSARIQQARHPLLSLGILLGVALLVVGGLWLVSSSGVVANRFKPQLERELSTALNREVTIGRIEGGLFDRVVLRNMRISAHTTAPDSIDITIQRVVVQYSLWDILVRKRPLAESLHQIQLIKPLIRFERTPDGKWLGPALASVACYGQAAGPAAPGPLLPPIKLSLLAGEIRINNGSSSASLKNLKGLLNLKDPSAARLFLSGRTNTGRRQNVKLSGLLDLPQQTYRLGLNATRVQLAELGGVFKLTEWGNLQSGEGDLNLKFASRPPSEHDWLPGMSVSGRAVLYNLALTTRLLPVPIQNVFGVVHLEDRDLSLKNMQAVVGQTAWSAQGEINNLQAPRLQIRVQSQNLDLDNLVKIAPNFRHLKTSGSGQATVLIKGPASDLTMTGTFNLEEGRVGRLAIRKFEVISKYHAGELRVLLARGLLARGSVEGKGAVVFTPAGQTGPTIRLQTEVRDLELEDMSELLGIKSLQGRINASLSVDGLLETPAVKGLFSSPRVKVEGVELKRLNGQFAVEAPAWKLRVLADWGPLSQAVLAGEAVREGEAWKLRSATLTHSGRELLRVVGQASLRPDRPWSGRITTRRLPLTLIPALPAGWKHLNGVVSFNGELSGTPAQPLLTGSFNASPLLKSDGASVDARGDLRLSPQGVDLSNAWVDAKRLRLEGHLGWHPADPLSARLILSRSPLSTLLLLAGQRPPEGTRGRFSGQVVVSGTLKELQSRGDVTVADLSWNTLAADTGTFKFTSQGRRIWLKELSLVQPRGKCNAFLETELGKTPGPFQMLAWMENFRLGGRTWSGDLRVRGTSLAGQKETYAAQLSLESFGVDGKSLPALRGQVEIRGNQLDFKNLTWGGKLTGKGSLTLSLKPQGRLELGFERSDLEPLRILLFPQGQEVPEPLTGSWRADFSSRQITSNLRLGGEQGALEGEIDLSLGKASWQSLEGRLQLDDMTTSTVLALFQAAAPEHAPQGRASGQVLFSGREGRLDRHSGDLTFTGFVFGHWKFKSLHTAWEQIGSELKIKRLEGLQPVGRLTAEGGSLQWESDGQARISLNLTAEQFAFFSRIFTGHFAVRGTMRTHPEWDLRLAVASGDFELNRYPFGDFRAQVQYQGENLYIRTPSDYPYAINGDLRLPPGGAVIFNRLTISDARQTYIDATGRVDGTATSDLRIKVKNVKADVIARSLGWPQPWTGAASGQFHYTDADHSARMEIDVKIENGSVLGLPFDVCSGNLLVDHDWLYFRGQQVPVVLTRFGKYSLTLEGKLPLPQSQAAAVALQGAEMDLRLTMPEGDLSFITFIPYIAAASGRSGLDLKIHGTMDYPTLSGRAWAEKATLAPRLYSPLVSNLNAVLNFNDNQVFIEQLEGTVGQGRLRLSAGSQAPWACVFRRLQPHELNLRLDSDPKKIRLESTPDLEYVSALADVHIHLGGTLEAPIAGGQLELGEGQLTFPGRPLTDFARNLKPANLSYDRFKIITRNNLWFYNDVARAQIKPDQAVVLNGGKNDFTAEGRISLAKGTFTYLNTDFNLDANEEAVLVFPGREKPRLEGLAKAVIRNVEIRDEGRRRDATIYLRVQGELGALKIKLESEPVMTQAQIVSLLTLGEDYSNWSQEQIDQKIQAAGARVLGRLAGNLIGREIGKSIKKFTPVDVIDVRLGGVEKLADSIMTGEGNTRSVQSGGSEITGTSLLQDTQIDIGKYVTDDLFLNYRGVLKDRGAEQGGLSWQSYLGLEYNLDPSKRIRVYKNFDVDSDQEVFWGIESRMQFKGWVPSDAEPDAAGTTLAPAGRQKP